MSGCQVRSPVHNYCWNHQIIYDGFIYIFMTAGLATQEHGSRSIRILSELLNPDCVYMVNACTRFIFLSVLRVAFEDATLTQCVFCHVLKRNTIHGHLLLMFTWTCVLIVFFFNLKLFRQSRKFYAKAVMIWILSGLARPLWIHIDLDPLSHVASPSELQRNFVLPSTNLREYLYIHLHCLL